MKRILTALWNVLKAIGRFLDRYIVLPVMGVLGRWMMGRVSAVKEGGDALEPWKAEAAADFKSWLVDLPPDKPTFAGPGHDSNDILMLLKEFATLRQEILLQNREQHKATSCLQEVVQSFQDISRVFEHNTQGLEHLVESVRRIAQKEAVLPFLSLRDVLVQGQAAAQAAAGKSFLRRPPAALGEAVDGYAAALLRLDRALEKLGILKVPAVGHMFDQKTMHTVSHRLEPGRARGIVLEELRGGYVRGNEVIRTAEVVVNG